MDGLQLLKQVFSKLSVDEFEKSAQEQKSFLQRLPAPKDDLERSYLQYRCQSYLMKKGLPFLLNCAAIPLLPLYRWKIRRNGKGAEKKSQRDAIMLFSGPVNVVPDSLKSEFDFLQVKDFQSHLQLSAEDLAYLHTLRRKYPFSFYYRFKCMLKLAMYSDAITAYHPKAIICSEEYSFTSSLLTDYCQQRGVAHINIMHGEKLYFIRDSFFRFHRCYVWDQHYIDLFSEMGAEPEQFRVEVPPSLQIKPQQFTEKDVDITYYLGGESVKQLERIFSLLQTLQRKGLSITVRPHPLYTDISVIQPLKGNIALEDPKTYHLLESLGHTKTAVALDSTVLLQAYYAGVDVLIDDVTAPDHYQKLQELQYIMMKKPHKLLSSLL